MELPVLKIFRSKKLMSMYKLDRSAFKAGSHESASDNRKFWETQSMGERLKAAAYLNSVAWNYPVDNPPKLDRTFFRTKKRN